VYNAKFSELTQGIVQWDKAFDKAYQAKDEKAMKYAESNRSQLSIAREEYKQFKTVLARFVRVYSYIAQLVELGDASLENFAAFAKLLSRRLDGIAPENIDLTGIVLTHYAIKKVESQAEGSAEPVHPVKGDGAEPIDREKEFLAQIIGQLNEIFGDVSDQDTRENYFNGLYTSVFNEPLVAEQVDKNTKEQALQGDLPRALKNKAFMLQKDYRELFEVIFKDENAMKAMASILVDRRKHETEARE
jgi:type I restriction enzyme R subunit